MTYLELVQMTAQQSGTITGVLPSTVFGQTNRLKLIVDFVSEAYTDIQNAHRQWNWLQSIFTGQTVASTSRYLATDFTDEWTALPITRFSQWGFKGDGSDLGLSMFLTSTGSTEEGPLRWLEPDTFYSTQMRGPQTPAKPQFYSVINSGELILSPVPDAVYTLRGKYRKGLQTLVADADEPEMPEEFHTIIKDAALSYLEGYDEGPRIPINRLRMLPNWSMLEHLQLPKPKWGHRWPEMPIEVQTSLMTGGLDLASPPIAVPPGKVIAASNYEPDISGYTSMAGYERFDGHERPSDSDDQPTIAARRSVIQPVPGTGPVRGVWVYDGAVYAFRDQEDGFAGMFKSTSGGWQIQAYGTALYFAVGVSEFIEGQYVTGVSSGASALILRVALRNGAWDGTAEGYLIVTDITGAFEEEEEITSTTGEAIALSTVDLSIQAGGRYDFTNHNFYGASSRSRMYFCNGMDTAFEWDGSTLASINTGTAAGVLTGTTYLLAPPQPPTYPDDFTILAADHVSPIILSATFDAPTYIAHFKNHLFLGYSTGSLINSSLGEPLQYITTTGAGEISFGEQITGLLTAASTSLVVFGQNRIEYVTGTDAATFTMQPLSDASGAQPYTVQMMDVPMFLDDGGIRSLSTTAAFGDWRMATVTQAVERLLRQKRDQGVSAIASMQIKAKDQYRLFWNDGSGITVYIGREHPETLPFYLDQDVFCTCQGEVEQGFGSRLFIGCENGFVYEMNRGTSFDGNAIDSYIRLPFTAAGSPMQNTRWMKVSFEIDTPDDLDIGVAFDVDYARGSGGVQSVVDVDAGSPIVTTQQYDAVDWTQPMQGRLEYHLAGIGPNISATLITRTAVARPHTISSQTYNFSRRGLKR